MADDTESGQDAWDCDHHPEWADNRNRCHHPDHPARDKESNACPRGHDRSAGRWCATCDQYGSHHTITHAHFACCTPPASEGARHG